MGQRDRHEHVQITLTTLIAPTGRNRFEHVGQLANLRRLICKIRPLASSSSNEHDQEGVPQARCAGAARRAAEIVGEPTEGDRGGLPGAQPQ